MTLIKLLAIESVTRKTILMHGEVCFNGACTNEIELNRSKMN